VPLADAAAFVCAASDTAKDYLSDEPPSSGSDVGQPAEVARQHDEARHRRDGQLSETEKQRRRKISMRNAGKSLGTRAGSTLLVRYSAGIGLRGDADSGWPRSGAAETIEKIKQRTKEALQKPEVRQKMLDGARTRRPYVARKPRKRMLDGKVSDSCVVLWQGT
jgi:hypothetical protein